MLAIPPFWASSNIALMRAWNKPPLEVVVANLENIRDRLMINNQNQIMVSVVMLSYNHEKYIKQAIESVLAQKTNFIYEILIGDDASIDNTINVLKQYSNSRNIRVFLRKRKSEGKHICHATKNAYILLQQARGKYIINLEGDDYWEKEDFLQEYVDFLETHPECVGISGRRKILSERTGKISINFLKENCNRKFKLEDLLQGETFDFCATLYRNIYHDKKCDYRHYLYSPIIGDLVSAVFILLHGFIYISDEIIGVYRTDRIKSASAYNVTRSSEQIYKEHIDLIQQLDNRIPIKLDYTNLIVKYTNNYLQTKYDLVQQLKAIIYIVKLLGIKRFILNFQKFIFLNSVCF